MMPVNYLHLVMGLIPELLLVAAALAVLGVDLMVLREESKRVRFGFGAGFTGFAALAAIFWMTTSTEPAVYLGGSFIVSHLTLWVKVGLLLLTLLTVALFVDGEFTEHVGECVALILFATVGMMLLVSAGDLLLLFVALELVSLSLYSLVAFDKRNREGIHAALQYFLYGGMAAAFMLFGFSLLYGLTGSTLISEVGKGLADKANDPVLLVAMVMVMVGLGFKVAAVPFHLWAPAVYQSAPGPAAALIASGSKLASFVVVARLMYAGFTGVEGDAAWRSYTVGWMPLLAGIAAFSMVLGNLAALAQSSLRRLLAFSAVAHAGYMLLGVLAVKETGLQAVIYYAFTYGVATIGAFGVAVLVERQRGGDSLANLAGMAKQSPLMAVCLMIFVLSLAGIPPLAGFVGKFHVFLSATAVKAPSLGLLWLVALAIATSAISLYYYLQVLKQAWVVPGNETVVELKPGVVTLVVLCLLAVLTIVLGCAPEMVLGPLAEALKSAW
ncbi:MAG TPA: NADH-quinone oxidoreductase subunit N [Verrucomicrobiae bacterium]